MIKATLKYNPYILETSASFNEKEPRINSEIEKYKNSRLQDWVKDIPRVFYEELNGFDFELDFVGPELEFEELVNVFEECLSNLDNERLTISHIKGIKNRETKRKQIDDTFLWLRDSVCDYFNFDEFCTEINDLINVHYPIFVLNGNVEDSNKQIENCLSIEYIENIEMLEETNLINVPFVIYIEDNFIVFQKQLLFIKSLKNVKDNQLFFIPCNTNKKKNYERFLQDLGIEQPLFVEKIEDKQIMDYIDAYPITQNIYELIHVFDKKINSIQTLIEEEGRDVESVNTDRLEYIEELTGKIERINHALKTFSMIPNFTVPNEWVQLKESTLFKLSKFKENHVTYYGQEMGEKEAKNYQMLIKNQMTLFVDAIGSDSSELKQLYEDKFYSIYISSGICDELEIRVVPLKEPSCKIPDLYYTLTNCFINRQIEEKGLFIKKDHPPKIYYRKEYSVVEWRKIVLKSVETELDKTIKNHKKSFENYINSLKEGYIYYLNEQKKELNREKKEALNNLSEDERRREKNLNWIEEFKMRVDAIKWE